MSYIWENKKNCKICGKSLKGMRSDADYCSANCRKAGSRRKGQMLKLAGDISSMIRRFEDYLADDELEESARGLLNELRSEIEVQLSVTAASVTDKIEKP